MLPLGMSLRSKEHLLLPWLILKLSNAHALLATSLPVNIVVVTHTRIQHAMKRNEVGKLATSQVHDFAVSSKGKFWKERQDPEERIRKKNTRIHGYTEYECRLCCQRSKHI